MLEDLFCMNAYLNMINTIDALPSTTAVHLSLMRQIPITTPASFHRFIKGTPLVCWQNKETVEGILELHFPSLFCQGRFQQEKTSLSFLARERSICQVFSEIEMMEESRHDSNLQHQPSQPTSSLSLSLFVFRLHFIPPLSQCHLMQLQIHRYEVLEAEVQPICL